jgi:hypothetical protein
LYEHLYILVTSLSQFFSLLASIVVEISQTVIDNY